MKVRIMLDIELEDPARIGEVLAALHAQLDDPVPASFIDSSVAPILPDGYEDMSFDEVEAAGFDGTGRDITVLYNAYIAFIERT